jgi:S-adenosyl methyltransferase
MSATSGLDAAEFDDRPTAAGVYDYALGGSANSPADRAHAEVARQAMPHVFLAAWANRGFLQRCVKYLATEVDIRQFIDLGAGFPTQGNTHEVVGLHRSDARILYVDKDPRVVARSNEIVADLDGAATIMADIRRPEDVLGHPETRRLIDFTQPVAVLAVGVTHFIPDADDPWGVIGRYVDAVVPGSYLALSAVTGDRQEERWEMVQQASPRYEGYPRPLSDVKRFFDGLEILPPYPGAAPVVDYVGLWGAEDPELADDDGSRLAYAALARKP